LKGGKMKEDNTRYNMKEIAERIKRRREEMQMSYQALAEKVNISKSTLQRYETGYIKNLPVDKFEDIAKALQVDPAYLMGWDEEKPISPRMQKVISRIPVFSTPISAGDGEWLSEGTEYEWANFENVPNNTDFALKVKGDSMSPIYNDGDVVFVRQGTFIESGDVGVFRLNGEGYLKMLKGSNLVSLNPKYEPVTIKESDNYYPAGKVVGKQERQV